MTGAIEGCFEVFNQLAKLHTKNGFSIALILGDLFSDPAIPSNQAEEAVTSLLNGNIHVPFATYFTIGKYPLPLRVQLKLSENDGELCSNLYFLGKHSVTKTSEGLRIVTLGGTLNPDLTVGLSKDEYLPFHTEGDVKALQAANSADILITSHWPTAIRSGSSVRLRDNAQEPRSESCIAGLCTSLKPRYHFSTSPQFFYEREPFFHLTKDGLTESSKVTRFISLAAYDNSAHQKWLYAFSIDNSKANLTALPQGTTISPFVPSSSSRKRQRQEGREDEQQPSSRHDNGLYHHGSRKRARGLPRGPESCFFCLSNPNIAAHLITSIGSESYLTTAKGPLTTSQTFPSLTFPGHVLIIPFSHSPTLASMNPQETKLSTYKEMRRYQKALQSLISFSSKGALGAVCWEINRRENIHVHWQLIPAPIDLMKKGLVEAGFRVEAENQKYPAPKILDIGDGSQEVDDYLRVWIWQPESPVDSALDYLSQDCENTGNETPLLFSLAPSFRFDLQFPRKVMAKLLSLEGRFRWQDCGQDEAIEQSEAEAFKKAFERFDFTLQEA